MFYCEKNFITCYRSALVIYDNLGDPTEDGVLSNHVGRAYLQLHHRVDLLLRFFQLARRPIALPCTCLLYGDRGTELDPSGYVCVAF